MQCSHNTYICMYMYGWGTTQCDWKRSSMHYVHARTCTVCICTYMELVTLLPFMYAYLASSCEHQTELTGSTYLLTHHTTESLYHLNTVIHVHAFTSICIYMYMHRHSIQTLTWFTYTVYMMCVRTHAHCAMYTHFAVHVHVRFILTTSISI